jgi:hypothetical protein
LDALPWSGSSVAVDAFRVVVSSHVRSVGESLSAGQLPKSDTIVFKTLQTYSNGDIVRWIDQAAAGSPDPAHLAPTLDLLDPSKASADENADAKSTATGPQVAPIPLHAHAGTGGQAAEAEGSSTPVIPLGLVALGSAEWPPVDWPIAFDRQTISPPRRGTHARHARPDRPPYFPVTDLHAGDPHPLGPAPPGPLTSADRATFPHNPRAASAAPVSHCAAKCGRVTDRAGRRTEPRRAPGPVEQFGVLVTLSR